METLVNSHLPSLIKDNPHIKECERCQNDIKAIALNQLKPHYTISDRGLMFTKMKELNHQFQSDIIQELARAIQMVENHPHHD